MKVTRLFFIVILLGSLGLSIFDTEPALAATNTNITATSKSRIMLAEYPQLQQVYAESMGQADVDYHLRAEGNDFTTTNLNHEYDVIFGETGIQLQVGQETWQMALTHYGYGETLHPVQNADIQAKTNKITYDRGNLSEWYINSPLGVQ